MDSIKMQAQQLFPALKDLKDHLHRNPETSFQEHSTTAILKQKLERLGLKFIDTGLDTGVVAVLEGNRPGKAIALRADIDAIAQRETAQHIVCSQTEGVMHGCGHDFHTACLIGAATLLSRLRKELAGQVVFIFQPAEEVTQGASALLSHGLWARLPQKPACIFGMHNRPELPCGQIAVMRGPVMAGKINFRITMRGKPGHGGSPHKCVDPIIAASSLVNAVQTIVSRNTDPLDALVCAVYSMHTDAPDFFVPTTLTMTGSIRFHRNAVGEQAAQKLRTIAEGIAASYGCAVVVELIPQVPVTENSESMTTLAHLAATQTVGEDHIVSPYPDMGSEDFAVYGEQIPAFFYWLGSGYPGRVNAPWHNPSFETDDDAIPLGVELLTRSVLVALEHSDLLSELNQIT